MSVEFGHAPRRVVDVMTGEIAEGAEGCQLHASALGSCIAIATYAPLVHHGVLAHVMLPGQAPPRCPDRPTRYAADAIVAILERMAARGAKAAELVVCLAGAGNVLNREDDTICRDNIASVTALLSAHGIVPVATSLGGNLRRSLTLDVTSGRFTVAEGDSPERELWRCAA